MLTIDARIDLAAFGRKLNQIPFATALTLTRIAQDAQLEVRRELGRRFFIRNTWVERGILFSPARKDTLVATVFSRDDFMVLQETGGTKTPRGKSVAVPGDVRTNKRGIITQANRPRALLAKKNTFRAKIGGVDGIWQRLGKRTAKRTGRALKLLFIFTSAVRIPPRFGFAETVRRVVRQRFPRQWALAVERAVKTAR